jgi:putative chitinase
MIAMEHLVEVMPNIPLAHAAEYAVLISRAMLEGSINTVLRAAAFLGQVAEETGDLRTLQEYASGAEYEGRHDLGNTQPGDGVRYKGRGGIQRTGRANYQRFQDATGIQVVDHPELLELPENAFRSDVLYWTDRGLNTYADRLDFDAIGKTINRGNPHATEQPNGWQLRLDKTRLALGVLGRDAIIITGDGVPEAIRR